MDVDVEEFLLLPENPPTTRSRIPWPAILRAILNKPVRVADIQRLVKELTGEKPAYSRISTWLDIRRKGSRELVGDVYMDIVVLKRYKGRRVYYLVTTPEFLERCRLKDDRE